jgi:hypothetical protein
LVNNFLANKKVRKRTENYWRKFIFWYSGCSVFFFLVTFWSG